MHKKGGRRYDGRQGWRVEKQKHDFSSVRMSHMCEYERLVYAKRVSSYKSATFVGERRGGRIRNTIRITARVGTYAYMVVAMLSVVHGSAKFVALYASLNLIVDFMLTREA